MQIHRQLAGAVAALCMGVAGLALSRLLYEGLFPYAIWLGRPLPVGLLALAGALGGRWLWRRGAAGGGPGTALAPFLPLLLNFLILIRPESDILRSALVFLGSLWLAAGMWLAAARPGALTLRRRTLPWFVLLLAALLPVYLLTMGRTVGRADTFEFQVVIPHLGIVHPTGYPLYLLLGKLFTFLPLGNVAWRINFSSVIYALGAAALVLALVRKLSRGRLSPLLAAVLLALSPTFWSQAIEAEVYTLHALVVGAALLLMVMPLETGEWGRWLNGTQLGSAADSGRQADSASRSLTQRLKRFLRTRSGLLLAFVLGLGLTNHLTTTILIPPAVLTAIFAIADRRNRSQISHRDSGRPQSPVSNRPGGPKLSPVQPPAPISILIAFLAPLLLYAYLPLRWHAVNGEPMGLARFVDWVVGGRFQGALHPMAFVEDPARYGIVWRLLLAEWQPSWLLFVSLVGFLSLLLRRRRVALILALTWLGYVFYGLSYYVPDLAVFLIPAHLVLAILWGVGLAAILEWLIAGVSKLERLKPWLPESRWLRPLITAAAVILVAVVVLPAVARRWPELDRSQARSAVQWAEGVLQLPLEEGAAILADSDKFPPLYYLQQAEGRRPDLEIMVLPDEAAYRAELLERLGAGQTVYLARFLPGLEGKYHLRAVGPLVEVGHLPLQTIPSQATPANVAFGPIQIRGYSLERRAAVDPEAVALTLYWQAQEAPQVVRHVYVRWQGEGYSSPPLPAAGRHPANNAYPTVAWEAGEIVPDYHLLPRPLLDRAETLRLEVALAPPFTPAPDLSWQAVTSMRIEAAEALAQAHALQVQVGSYLLDGVQVPAQIRPQETLTVLASGCGDQPLDLGFVLQAVSANDDEASKAAQAPATTCRERFVRRVTLTAPEKNGQYEVVARVPGAAARCGWLAGTTSGCPLVKVEVSGVPLPAGATNFADKIALLELEAPDKMLRPGAVLPVRLTWQALAPMQENYTVFVQVVDARDQIVGQVDSWPVQGTYPTSSWQVGEVVEDAYRVQLDAELEPGLYRLLAGWYLLRTQERLPVLDKDGAPIDDKIVVPGFSAR